MLYCLMKVLGRRLGPRAGRWMTECGLYRKFFIPVPGENNCAVCQSLFGRQLPVYLA